MNETLLVYGPWDASHASQSPPELITRTGELEPYLRFQTDTVSIDSDDPSSEATLEETTAKDEDVLLQVVQLLEALRVTRQDGPLIKRLERAAEEAKECCEPAENQEAGEAPSPAVEVLEAEVERWRSRAAELERQVAETRNELEQMRSERNVTRGELETLQRRWQQQVGEYDQRLNAARVECERLQRELDSMSRTTCQEGIAASQIASPHDVDSSCQSGAGNRPVEAECDLRYVFTRIRNRCQEPPADIEHKFDPAIGTTTYIVGDH